MTNRLVISFLAVFTGCTPLPDLPELESSTKQDDEYQDFVPLESVSLEQSDAQQSEETETALEARVSSLRSRAAQLRAANTE